MASVVPKYVAQTLKPRSVLREISMLLNKDGPVWLTIKSLTSQLKNENINYAVIGGLAVYQHGYERTTPDCDILLPKVVNMFLSINQYLTNYDYFLIRIMRHL